MQTLSKKFSSLFLSQADIRTFSLSYDVRLVVAFALAVWLYLSAGFQSNEWLYLLASSTLLVALLGLTLPALQVLSVDAEASFPEDAVAEETAEISIQLKRRHSLRWLTTVFPLQWVCVRPCFRKRTPPWITDSEIRTTTPAVVDQIIQPSSFRFNLPDLDRGVYDLMYIEVSSCFPFGLVWASRRFSPKAQQGRTLSLSVHPRTYPMSGDFLDQVPGLTSAMGMSFSSKLVALQSTTVRTIREYKIGDSPRHIHWPSSARTGRLLIREYDSEQLPVFDILLDLNAKWQSKAQFELAVCVVNSLIHLGYERDMPPELLFNPPLNSDVVCALIDDLPHMRSAEELLSDTLARVEPIPSHIMKHTPNLDRQTRPVLTIEPSVETLVSHSVKSRADKVVRPVIISFVTSDDGQNPGTVLATVYDEEMLATI